jgi:hypothetical protein
MPETESCLYPAHELAPYRTMAASFSESSIPALAEIGERIDELIAEIERLRDGITWGLSALHDDPEAPKTYERMAELAYEMASRIEGLLPPTPAQIADELERAQQADALSY